MYRVAGASEYLVITGKGIRGIKIAKKAWISPGQSCTIFDVSPVNYTCDVFLPVKSFLFSLPIDITVGPHIDGHDSVLKYAKLFHRHHPKKLVEGIVARETYRLAASMTKKEVFKVTMEFKQELFEKVQLELNQFGLLIYNANINQFVDELNQFGPAIYNENINRLADELSNLGQKTQMEAANQAKVDVAEARMKGEIGSKLREEQKLQFTLDSLTIPSPVYHKFSYEPGHDYLSNLGQKTQMEVANQAKVDVAEARMKGEIGSKLRGKQKLQVLDSGRLSSDQTAPLPPTTVSAGPRQPEVTPDPLTGPSTHLGGMNGRSSANVRASINSSQTAGTLDGRRGLPAPPASLAGSIEINIMQLDSPTYTLQVDKHVRVTALKEQVAAVTGVSSEQQRLISHGGVLKDDQLLSAYHVEDGHTLHLVMRRPSPSSPSDSGDSNNSQTAGARVRGGVQEDSDGPAHLPAVWGLAEIYRFIKQTLDEQAGVMGQLMGLLQAYLNLTDPVAWRTTESNAKELCDLLKNYAITLLETSRKIVTLPIDRLSTWVSPNRGNSSRGRPRVTPNRENSSRGQRGPDNPAPSSSSRVKTD